MTTFNGSSEGNQMFLSGSPALLASGESIQWGTLVQASSEHSIHLLRQPAHLPFPPSLKPVPKPTENFFWP